MYSLTVFSYKLYTCVLFFIYHLCLYFMSSLRVCDVMPL